MSEAKIKVYSASLYVHGWKAQDAVRRAYSCIRKHPARSTRIVLDYGVAKPAKNLAHGAMQLGKALWEPLPWAASHSVKAATTAKQKYVAACARAGQPRVLEVPQALRDAATKHKLKAGLTAAQATARKLNQAPPRVRVNANQYALHVGCMLPLKAAKMMGVAAIVHATPLGHMALGHLLAPSAEDHLLAAAGLHGPEELGLSAGIIACFHGAFSRTLQNSNLSEYDQERSNYSRQQAQTRAQLKSLRRAVALQEKLAAGDGKVPRAQLERLDRALDLASRLTEAAGPTTQAAAESVQAVTPATEPARAVTPATDKTAKDFLAQHPSQRASGQAWERFSQYFDNRAAKLRKEAGEYEANMVVASADAVDPTLSEGERTRAKHRSEKLSAKMKWVRRGYDDAHLTTRRWPLRVVLLAAGCNSGTF